MLNDLTSLMYIQFFLIRMEYSIHLLKYISCIKKNKRGISLEMSVMYISKKNYNIKDVLSQNKNV